MNNKSCLMILSFLMISTSIAMEKPENKEKTSNEKKVKFINHSGEDVFFIRYQTPWVFVGGKQKPIAKLSTKELTMGMIQNKSHPVEIVVIPNNITAEKVLPADHKFAIATKKGLKDLDRDKLKANTSIEIGKDGKVYKDKIIL